jgi:phosphoribosylanthranilate isomerase
LSSTRFKVCCIRNVAEAELAYAHGAAAVGLVSQMPSGPGVIDDKTIADVARTMTGRIETFLLTAEKSAARIAEQVRQLRPSTVQLVDTLPAGQIATLRRLAPQVSIVTVIHVMGQDSIGKAIESAQASDALLLDSGNPNLAVKELGGTGRTHDWETSARIVAAADAPVWLAGGLNPENVAEAIARVRPYGVDVCNGLRPDRATHALDPTLLRRFADAVPG